MLLARFKVTPAAGLLPALALAVACLLPPTPVSAQADDPWNALPDSTLLVVRMPGMSQAITKLRAQTLLGQRLLTTERWEAIKDEMRRADPDQWREMNDQLGRVGLSVDDMPSLATGSAGFAMATQSVAGRSEPLLVGLGWWSPGENRAERMLAQFLDQIKIGKDGVQARVDHQIAGLPVVQLTTTNKSARNQAEALPGDAGEAPASATTSFITRRGGTLLVSFVDPSVTTGGAANPAAREAAITQARQMFGQFLTTLQSGRGQYGARTLSAPGMAEAMPEGDTLFEAHLNLQQVVGLIMRQVPPQAQMAAGMLSLGDLTQLSARFSLDGRVFRSGMFLAAPQPRRGVLSLLDQPNAEPTPPNWVPLDVLAYGHLSVDLGDVYRKIQNMVLEQMGDQAAMAFQQIDMQARGMSGLSMQELLSSLGARHQVVTFEPAPGAMDDPTGMGANRVAIVWDLARPEAWRTLMQSVAMFAAQTNGQIVPTQLQGFSGYQINVPFVQGSLMLGENRLVLSIGEGVTAEVLSTLNNPPAADRRLADSELVRRAQTLGRLKPSISYQVADYDKSLNMLYGMLMAGLQQNLATIADPAQQAQARAAASRIAPSADEIQGMAGVSGGQTFMTAGGLVSESFVELTPAE